MTAYKVIVDPSSTANGQVIIYAALSDIDPTGQT